MSLPTRGTIKVKIKSTERPTHWGSGWRYFEKHVLPVYTREADQELAEFTGNVYVVLIRKSASIRC